MKTLHKEMHQWEENEHMVCKTRVRKKIIVNKLTQAQEDKYYLYLLVCGYWLLSQL